MKTILENESNTLIDWFTFNQMQANPEKFQAISVGQKTSSAIKSFNIAGKEIACEDQVKLLGIDIDYMLNFDAQISTICKKAAMQLNVLQRLSKFLTTNSRLTIFKSFVRSNFNFCPTVWHFCSKTNTKNIRKTSVQSFENCFQWLPGYIWKLAESCKAFNTSSWQNEMHCHRNL